MQHCDRSLDCHHGECRAGVKLDCHQEQNNSLYFSEVSGHCHQLGTSLTQSIGTVVGGHTVRGNEQVSQGTSTSLPPETAMEIIIVGGDFWRTALQALVHHSDDRDEHRKGMHVTAFPGPCYFYFHRCYCC